LTSTIPRAAIVDALGGYLAANKVDKPDIWRHATSCCPRAAATRRSRRDLDSGVDTALFRERLVTRRQAAVIGFDRFEKPRIPS